MQCHLFLVQQIIIFIVRATTISGRSAVYRRIFGFCTMPLDASLIDDAQVLKINRH